jgi:hypothetical protein
MTKLFLRFAEEVADLFFRLAYGNVGSLEKRSRAEVRATIKALRKLQKEGVYIYGAVNRLRVKGSPLSITLTAGGVTAGSVGVCQSAVGATAGFAGIVESAKDGNGVAVLHTEGVWLLPSFVVVTGISPGDPIYAIPGTGVLTQTAAGNLLIAKSLVTLGAGAAQVSAKLVGSN